MELWGYTVNDSRNLKEEIEKQAFLAFQSGEYELGEMDDHGQRINIVVHLKRNNNGTEVSFVTGWMSYPGGKLVLITPFGGRV